MTRRSKTNDLARANRDSYFRHVRPPEPLENVQLGDVVGLTAYHLIQIGLGPLDEEARDVGPVTEIHPNGIWVRVAFGLTGERWIARQHLARPGPNSRWCNVS